MTRGTKALLLSLALHALAIEALLRGPRIASLGIHAPTMVQIEGSGRAQAPGGVRGEAERTARRLPPDPTSHGAPAQAQAPAATTAGPDSGARAGGAAEAGGDSPEILTTIRQAIHRNLRYPRQLQALGVGGTAVLSLSVAADGRLVDARVSGASGHPELDAAALEAATAASPFPTSSAPVRLSLPVEFRPAR